MSIWNKICGFFGIGDDYTSSQNSGIGINPATSLPILNNSGIDVGGNPLGMDLHQDTWSATSAIDDHFASSSSIFNDSFGSSFDSFGSD